MQSINLEYPVKITRLAQRALLKKRIHDHYKVFIPLNSIVLKSVSIIGNKLMSAYMVFVKSACTGWRKINASLWIQTDLI